MLADATESDMKSMTKAKNRNLLSRCINDIPRSAIIKFLKDCSMSARFPDQEAPNESNCDQVENYS